MTEQLTKPGDYVCVYDRFRFAIPVFGTIIRHSDSNDGVEILLATTNNAQYPEGSTIWVSEKQVRIAKPNPVMRKAKMLAWFTGVDLVLREESRSGHVSWKRAPAEDKEIEVEE